jgi:outer membrane protein assembly factor BamB
MHVARRAVLALAAIVAIVAAASSVSAAAPQPFYTVCNNSVGSPLAVDAALGGSFVCATATNLQRIDARTGNVVWTSSPYPNGTATHLYVSPLVIARAGVIFYSGAAYSIATGNLVWRVPAAAAECATSYGVPYVDATQRVLAVACNTRFSNTLTIYSLDPKTGRFVNAPYRFSDPGGIFMNTRIGANTLAFASLSFATILINYDIPRGRLLWSRPFSPSNGFTLIVPGEANWTLALASNLDAFDRTGRKLWSVPASAVNALLNFKTVTGMYRTIGLDAAGHAVLWDQGTGQQLWRSPYVVAVEYPDLAYTTLASPGVVAIKTESGVVWGIDVARAVPEVAYNVSATIFGGPAATIVPIATLPGAPVPQFLLAADAAQNVYKIDKSGAVVRLRPAPSCGGDDNWHAFVPPTLNFVVVSSRCNAQMFLI